MKPRATARGRKALHTLSNAQWGGDSELGDSGDEKGQYPLAPVLSMYNLIRDLFSALNIPQTLYEHDHREKGRIFAQRDNDQELGHHEEQELVGGASVRIGMERGRSVSPSLLYRAVKFGLPHLRPVLYRRFSRRFYLIT